MVAKKALHDLTPHYFSDFISCQLTHSLLHSQSPQGLCTYNFLWPRIQSPNACMTDSLPPFRTLLKCHLPTTVYKMHSFFDHSPFSFILFIELSEILYTYRGFWFVYFHQHISLRKKLCAFFNLHPRSTEKFLEHGSPSINIC